MQEVKRNYMKTGEFNSTINLLNITDIYRFMVGQSNGTKKPGYLYIHRYDGEVIHSERALKLCAPLHPPQTPFLRPLFHLVVSFIINGQI